MAGSRSSTETQAPQWAPVRFASEPPRAEGRGQGEELLELLGAIGQAARRQGVEASERLREERLRAAERLTDFEEQGTAMRKEP